MALALIEVCPVPPEFNTFARNAREVARRKAVPIRQLLDEFRSKLETIMHIYHRMSDEDWLKPAWFFVGPVKVRAAARPESVQSAAARGR